jgi:hypothetical protein
MAFFHLGNTGKSRGFSGLPVAASCGGRLIPQPANVLQQFAGREACYCWKFSNTLIRVSLGLLFSRVAEVVYGFSRKSAGMR